MALLQLQDNTSCSDIVGVNAVAILPFRLLHFAGSFYTLLVFNPCSCCIRHDGTVLPDAAPGLPGIPARSWLPFPKTLMLLAQQAAFLEAKEKKEKAMNEAERATAVVKRLRSIMMLRKMSAAPTVARPAAFNRFRGAIKNTIKASHAPTAVPPTGPSPPLPSAATSMSTLTSPSSTSTSSVLKLPSDERHRKSGARHRKYHASRHTEKAMVHLLQSAETVAAKRRLRGQSGQGDHLQ
jgi:hypothetical protein